MEDQGRKRFAWRSHLLNVRLEPGEYALETPFNNPHVAVTLILDQTAAGLDQALAVRSVKGHTNRVPLLFRTDPKQPVRAVRVTISVHALKSLGGFANIAVSSDGTNWSEPVRNDPAHKTQQLTVASPVEGESDAPLWVRIMLEGLAGKPSNRAAALDWFEVSASFPRHLSID